MKVVHRLFVMIFCLSVAATGAVLWGKQGLQAIGNWLSYESACAGEPQLAALLLGGINSRPKAASSWLRRHPATRLVVARSRDEELQHIGILPNEGLLTRTVLTSYGIDSNRVTVLPEPQVANTFEEVQRLVAFTKAQNPTPTQLFILTSWSHSRRAAWTAEHIADEAGIKICMVPLTEGENSPIGWWHTDRGTLDVFSEYVKSLRYGFKYALR